MGKRIVAAFSIFVLLCVSMYARIYQLTSGDEIASVAQTQSTYTVDVAHKRGMIYDCNFKPLLNDETYFRAAVAPSQQAMLQVGKVLNDDENRQFYEKLTSGKPFVLNVPTDKIYARGVEAFEVYRRYSKLNIAPHIVGYTSDGAGVSGIEKSFDDYLEDISGKLQVTYTVNAIGSNIAGIAPEIEQEGYDVKQGVVLTLDRDLQLLCQSVAEELLPKGAIVVMDVESGDLLASVSTPIFNRNDLSASIEDQDTPFLNRAFSAYSVGSTFKLLVAAAALEDGFSTQRAYTCKGYIDVGGQIFKCHHLPGHGEITMEHALEISCNPYFISLALELGAEKILAAAQHIGFGTATEFAAGLFSDSGTLPTMRDLQNPADVANLGFGQGKLTATPVQIAALISTLANGGASVTPRLVLGFSNEAGTAIAERAPAFAANSVMKPSASSQVTKFMRSVVVKGSGITANPEYGGAGGKTASAQTGQYIGEEEKVEAWFSGFYPAEEPKYAIVVFAENGQSGGEACAPVFKRVADGIYWLKYAGKYPLPESETNEDAQVEPTASAN